MKRSYIGVAQRSFQSAVVHLLETDYGLLGSRRVLEMLAEDVGQLALDFHPAQTCVQSGWLVFTGTKVTGQKATQASRPETISWSPSPGPSCFGKTLRL